MDRVEKIWMHPTYKMIQKRLDELEVNRRFCKHDVKHSMDVARIFYILTLEAGIEYEKSLIYAVALLHDLGRVEQYENGTPHDEAGEKIAFDILKDCDFAEEEIEIVLNAIRGHRKKCEEENSFSVLLYQADKLSRACYQCEAEADCYWSESKKNLSIRY